MGGGTSASGLMRGWATLLEGERPVSDGGIEVVVERRDGVRVSEGSVGGALVSALGFGGRLTWFRGGLTWLGKAGGGGGSSSSSSDGGGGAAFGSSGRSGGRGGGGGSARFGTGGRRRGSS